MARFRIMTNGKYFKVQRRYYCFWFAERYDAPTSLFSHLMCMGCGLGRVFFTCLAAKEYITDTYGSSAQIVAPKWTQSTQP